MYRTINDPIRHQRPRRGQVGAAIPGPRGGYTGVREGLCQREAGRGGAGCGAGPYLSAPSSAAVRLWRREGKRCSVGKAAHRRGHTGLPPFELGPLIFRPPKTM